MLTFDAVLAFYSFSAGGGACFTPGAAVGGGGGGEQLVSPVCEQRLGRWHASTCAMAFHGGETDSPTGRGGQATSGLSYTVVILVSFWFSMKHAG